MTEPPAQARVGTSAWDKDRWRRNFYPPELPRDRELEFAAHQLTSLEINTTFYGLKSVETFLRWRDRTPMGFVFSLKGNRLVTHDHLLRNPARNVADFLGSGVLALQEKLGPLLWQIPDTLPFQPDIVEAFFAVLPHSVAETQLLIRRHGAEGSEQALLDVPDRPIRHCLEVRHASFLTPAFSELLSRYDVAAVVTNSPGWPVIRDVTSDFVYVRLHGDINHYPDGYDDAALDGWAESVNGWLSGEGCPDGRGRDVFVYFDNPDNSGIRSPFDAMHLQDRLIAPNTSVRSAGVVQPPLWE